MARALVPGRGSSGIPTTRLTITLESEHAKKLEAIAAEKGVSIAWVVRDAIERHLRSSPLGKAKDRNA